MSGPRLDCDAGLGEPHAFVDAAQPESTSRALARHEPDAVVDDAQFHALVRGHQLYGDRVCAGVAGGVTERLLGHPEQAERDGRGERVEVVPGAEDHLEVMKLLDVGAVIAKLQCPRAASLSVFSRSAMCRPSAAGVLLVAHDIQRGPGLLGLDDEHDQHGNLSPEREIKT